KRWRHPFVWRWTWISPAQHIRMIPIRLEREHVLLFAPGAIAAVYGALAVRARSPAVPGAELILRELRLTAHDVDGCEQSRRIDAVQGNGCALGLGGRWHCRSHI